MSAGRGSAPVAFLAYSGCLRVQQAPHDEGTAVAARTAGSKSLTETLRELWQLLQDYAKQETVDPLKRLGRFVGFGVPAALCAAVGAVLLLLAVLRVLQRETYPHLAGNLSWIPYLVTLAIAGFCAGVGGLLILRKKGRGTSR